MDLMTSPGIPVSDRDAATDRVLINMAEVEDKEQPKLDAPRRLSDR